MTQWKKLLFIHLEIFAYKYQRKFALNKFSRILNLENRVNLTNFQ